MRTKFATPILHAVDIFKSSNLVIFLYYVIDTVYIYSWEKIDKTLTHFGDATYQKYIFFVVARSVQIDNGVTPPPPSAFLVLDLWSTPIEGVHLWNEAIVNRAPPILVMHVPGLHVD